MSEGNISVTLGLSFLIININGRRLPGLFEGELTS